MCTHGLFKCLFSFTLDHDICFLMRVELYESSSLNIFSKKFLCLSRIYIKRKELFLKRIYDSKILSYKRHIKSIKRMYICHQKDIKLSEGSQAYQKDGLSRRLWPEGWSSEDDLHEVPHSQSQVEKDSEPSEENQQAN